MKTLCLIALTLLPAAARAGAFDDLALPAAGLAAVDVPAPPPAEEVRAPAALPACPKNMRGDASVPCLAVTPKTTVCSDGQKISAARVTDKDIKAGKYPAALLGKFKDPDLRAWAEHQKKLGKSDRWSDGSHQSVLAAGKISALTTPYVVLPNRAWLGRAVTVCVTATGACVEARALEVGPNSTFKDHAELSVRALMDLGLDAHPASGTYYGEMTFSFH